MTEEHSVTFLALMMLKLEKSLRGQLVSLKYRLIELTADSFVLGRNISSHKHRNRKEHF